MTSWPVRAWCLSLANTGRAKLNANTAPHGFARAKASRLGWGQQTKAL